MILQTIENVVYCEISGWMRPKMKISLSQKQAFMVCMRIYLSPTKVEGDNESMWSSEQITWWRSRQKAYLADRIVVEQDQAIDLQRMHIKQEILLVLSSFLDGTIGLKEFNATFQQRTHSRWSGFHLRGMSGGLFFNKLVKHVPSDDTFAHLLRLIIRAPEDMPEGQQHMQAFVCFLEGLISAQQVQRAQIQPARVPFFLSIWWHIQAQEQWPIFYTDVRQALMGEGQAGTSSLDPIEAYFAFRTRFLALAQRLGISSWELEHLCIWSITQNLQAGSTKHKKQPVISWQADKRTSPQKQTCLLVRQAEIKGRQASEEKAMDDAIACRTHIQWLLAKIGQKVGCRVWIATGDHSKACNNEKLHDLSLPSLPILADSALQKVIGKIDVLWFLDQAVIAAYEIEQACTDVSISLLRLSDLRELFPDRRMNLCLVVPRDRFEKVQFELSRPAFQARDMQQHCALISEERLLEHGEHILRWATSPAVIKDLICAGDGKEP